MTPPVLRSYQRRARALTYDQIRAGARGLLVVAPAGSGKTITAASMVADAVRRGKRANWYAHRRELARQARAALARFGVDDAVHVLSYQGVCARGEAPPADFVVYDECHHLGSKEDADWKRVVDVHRDSIRLGLTATPERHDGQALEGFDVLIEVASYSELIAAGHIVPCRPEDVRAPHTKLGKRELLCSPLEAYQAHAPGTVAVVYGLTVEECQTFAAAFCESGIPAEVVHGKLTKTARDAIIARWMAGITRIVVNVGILTEGFDFAAIETVILARGCGSAGLFIQMGCRGSRPHPGKSRFLLLDLSGASHEHGSPTDDRIYSLSGVGIQRAGVEMPSTVLCQRCGLPVPCLCPPLAEDMTHTIVGDAADLAPYIARMRAEDGPERRVDRLASWLRRQEAGREHLAANRFRAVYGRMPTDGEHRDATARMVER